MRAKCHQAISMGRQGKNMGSLYQRTCHNTGETYTGGKLMFVWLFGCTVYNDFGYDSLVMSLIFIGIL